MQARTAIWTFAVVIIAGCGSSSPSTTADAARYDALAHEVAAATTSYCDAHSWASDPAACASAEAAHQHALAPDLQEMAGMAGHLDDAEHQSGHDDHADCTCTIDDMEGELARHHAAACAGTVADRDTEAARHCGAMMTAAARMHARAGELMHHMDEWPWPAASTGGATSCPAGMSHGM